MATSAIGWAFDERSEPRDAVHFRARGARADGRAVPLLIVNTSAQGLMARCDTDCAPGERITVELPMIGAVTTEVRWSLGGRIGCQHDRPLSTADYYGMLAAMERGR